MLRFIKEFKDDMGGKPATPEAVREQCWKVLNSGRVIPGYGHAVLRKTDPRFTCQVRLCVCACVCVGVGVGVGVGVCAFVCVMARHRDRRCARVSRLSALDAVRGKGP